MWPLSLFKFLCLLHAFVKISAASALLLRLLDQGNHSPCPSTRSRRWRVLEWRRGVWRLCSLWETSLSFSATKQSMKKVEGLGHTSTVSYAAEIARLVVQETDVLPHMSVGVMSRNDVPLQRHVSVIQGLMLEPDSEKPLELEGSHYKCPDRVPSARRSSIAAAGLLAACEATCSFKSRSKEAGGAKAGRLPFLHHELWLARMLMHLAISQLGPMTQYTVVPKIIGQSCYGPRGQRLDLRRILKRPEQAEEQSEFMKHLKMNGPELANEFPSHTDTVLEPTLSTTKNWSMSST